MKVLVIGGTGFISSRLVVNSVAKGHDVTVLNRGKTLSAYPGGGLVRALVADRTSERDLHNAVKGEAFDVVFDMVAYGPEDSRIAVNVFKGNVGRFIHCSTISVYMVSREVQCPITEDQDKGPLMPFFSRNPFGMDYGINKRKCEEVLWAAHDPHGFAVSMIRPTFVSGPRDPAGREWFWIERILDGGPLLVPGSGDFAFQNVYVEDVAAAFALLPDVPASVGQAYNIAAAEIFTLNDYLGLLAEMLGKESDLVHVDQSVFDKLPFSLSREGDVFPFNTRRLSVFSLEKSKRELGYRPTPVSEWLPATIEWYRSVFRGHSNGFSNRAEEIAFAERWKHEKDRWLKERQHG